MGTGFALPLISFALTADAQPTNPECTGVMALRSPSGSPHGPWEGPNLLYNPSAPGAPKEWYSKYGVNNPSLLVLPNGTALLAGRTCSWPEYPWVAMAGSWGGRYRSIDDDSPPFSAVDVEDPFLWRDSRGNFHMLHHWQGNSNHRVSNGGHSFSQDGVLPMPRIQLDFLKHCCLRKEHHLGTREPGARMVCYGQQPLVNAFPDRRERPGLLLSKDWSAPLALFTSVSQGRSSWLQGQPIRQDPPPSYTGGPCGSDDDCSLNGICEDGTCHCDPQWEGPDCGVLSLLPAEPDSGYRRYHAFTVEMTFGCPIGDYLTNSQIVHVQSDTPTGAYALAAIKSKGSPALSQLTSNNKVGLNDPAPNSTILVLPFAHAAHTSLEPATEDRSRQSSPSTMQHE
eukprot:gene86-358_t